MSRIFYSEEESAFFKLKIGRGKSENLSPLLLEKQMLAGGYDLCRLKVSAGDLNSANALEELNFPYYHAGEVINYTITLDEIKKMNLETGDAGISYERYDGSQKKIVKDIILKNCGDDPIGYYKTPFLNSLITAKKESAFLASYFSENYISSNKMILFMKKNGDYAGLIAYSIADNTLESLLVTLTPEHRHYANLSHFIKETFRFTKEHGIAAIVCGARLNNRMMQYIFEKYGRKNGADIIWHIMPFLSSDHNKVARTNKKKKFRNEIELFETMQHMAFKASRSSAGNLLPSFWRMKQIGKIPLNKTTTLSTYMAATGKKNSLCISKAFDDNNRLAWIGYHGYYPMK